MLDREKARHDVLAAVREIANQHPEADYGFAREQLGLLGRIKGICRNVMPTARQCWEFVGLDRSKLIDEFAFAQDDLKTSRLYPHQEQALKALRETNRLILQVR